MRLRTWILVSTFVLLAQGSVLAQAKGDPKEIFTRATAHYDLGKYKMAAEEFEQLYELVPDQVVLLYNIAQAYRLGGENEKALFFYRAFIRRVPNNPKMAEVKMRVAALEKVQEASKKTRETAPNELDRKPPESKPVEPGEPTTTKPADLPRLPPVEGTEPTTKPTEPTTKPTEATEPTTKPTEPTVTPETTKPTEPEVAPTDDIPTPPKKASKKWVWGVVVPLVLLAAGGGVLTWWLLTQQGSSFTANFPEVGPNVQTSALLSF